MLSTLASRYSRQFASAAARTFSSKGEVVVVTGASSGIGYDTAKLLAASGYRVVGAARRVEKLGGLVADIEAAGGTASACHLDVTKEETYETLFKFAEACYGGVDHVFMSAGAAGRLVGPADMEGAADTEGFSGTLNTNLVGCILGMKHGIKALRKRGGGSIVLAGSSNAGGAARGAFAGPFGDLTLITPYSLCSASLDQLVRMSSYYANENIRVYGLKPGIVSSAMLDDVLDSFKAIDPETNEDSFSGFNLFFRGLPGNPIHVGHVVETLINNTTKWPAGSNINIDNDATIDSSFQYKICDTDTLLPEVALEDLRGYDGGEYVSKEDRTAEFIKNLKDAE